MADVSSPYRLTYASPVAGAECMIPFVIGDFSGRDDRSSQALRFVDIDRDSFDAVMSDLAPESVQAWRPLASYAVAERAAAAFTHDEWPANLAEVRTGVEPTG